jgi:hypothetical protein
MSKNQKESQFQSAFIVIYGNGEKEVFTESETLLDAQLSAHEKAATKKTIVISVKPL